MPKDAPKTSIDSLQPGERFVFHPGNTPCVFVGTSGGGYTWTDYQGRHHLQAGYYAGTGKTAWPYVYPLDPPPAFPEDAPDLPAPVSIDPPGGCARTRGLAPLHHTRKDHTMSTEDTRRPNAFDPLQRDGSNLAGYMQRRIIDPLCGLSAVADELEQHGDISRAVSDIRALVGDESAGLWHDVGELHSRADEWLTAAPEGSSND